MAELEDLRPTAQGGGGKADQVVGVLVRGDDVEVGGEEAVQERVWRGLVNLPNGVLEGCQLHTPSGRFAAPPPRTKGAGTPKGSGEDDC